VEKKLNKEKEERIREVASAKLSTVSKFGWDEAEKENE